jgi:hypothetical protein
MDLMGIITVLTFVLGGVNLGLVLKLMYNHLEHLIADVKELRQMFVEHLRDHGKDA